MSQIIPLTSEPNQTMVVQLYVNGTTINIRLSFRYNEVANYWVMSVTDPETGDDIVTSIPLICGDYPCADLMGRFSYKRIGSAYLLNMGSSMDSPDSTNLGDDFQLIWGDNGQKVF